MNLLGAVSYDPVGGAVSKATSSLLAMTALDTSNLRVAVTIPAHGKIYWRIMGCLTGATTLPSILVGILNGATLVGRAAPQYFTGTQNVATQNPAFIAEGYASGLTPGAMNLDAAYAVQVVVAATNIKYGGPNNNSGANAWGAFTLEIWDPQPLTAALDGGVNVKQWNGTNVSAPATAGIPDVNVKNINNVAAATPGASGGILISGSNAGTTTLAALTITGVTTHTGNVVLSDGLTISAPSTGNRAGLDITGNGTGAGFKITGGATGNGMSVIGGGTSGDGIKVTTTSGHGVNLAPVGTSMHGLLATGGNGGTSDGIKAAAGTGGVDLRAAITGNVTGNLSGSVGSVTGAVGSVTGSVASVTGAVGSVTGAVGSVTGNVGGNVVGSVASVTARVTANIDQVDGAALTAHASGKLPADVLTVAGTAQTATDIGAATKPLESGTAQTGANGSITLRAGASATDNLYRGEIIEITSGTGAGQSRVITGYTGSSKVATVDENWITNPSSDSVYTIAQRAAKMDSSQQVTAASVQGSVTGSVASVTGAVGSVTGLTASNLDAAVSSRMATYTQPTGFLAATFPAGTIANTTNITAGTITTATNLTNAPTAGDFTSTMKTSIGTAVAASAVASVTGNVGGNVAGSVGSVTGLTASNLDVAVSTRLATSGYTAPDNTRPTNFTALAITAGGAVTAGTVSDKTGYALTAAYDPAKTAALDAAGTRSALGLASANLDTQLDALPTASEVRAELDGNSTKLAHLDANISTRLAASSYSAPDNDGIGVAAAAAASAADDAAAIKLKTDSLTFTRPGKLDVNILVVNGTTLTGSGAPGDPIRPA